MQILFFESTSFAFCFRYLSSEREGRETEGERRGREREAGGREGERGGWREGGRQGEGNRVSRLVPGFYRLFNCTGSPQDE